MIRLRACERRDASAVRDRRIEADPFGGLLPAARRGARRKALARRRAARSALNLTSPLRSAAARSCSNASQSRASTLPSLNSSVARCSSTVPPSSSLTIASMRASFASNVLGKRLLILRAPIPRELANVPRSRRALIGVAGASAAASRTATPSLRDDRITARERPESDPRRRARRARAPAGRHNDREPREAPT